MCPVHPALQRSFVLVRSHQTVSHSLLPCSPTGSPSVLEPEGFSPPSPLHPDGTLSITVKTKPVSLAQGKLQALWCPSLEWLSNLPSYPKAGDCQPGGPMPCPLQSFPFWAFSGLSQSGSCRLHRHLSCHFCGALAFPVGWCDGTSFGPLRFHRFLSPVQPAVA